MNRFLAALLVSTAMAAPAVAQDASSPATSAPGGPAPGTNAPGGTPPGGTPPGGTPPGGTPPAVNLTSPGTPPTPDKSGYNLFNPTPENLLRGFSSDRPTKSNSPITVDAGYVQYETDAFNYQHSNAGGISTRIYTFADPVLKLGITNYADFEVQFTGYNIDDFNTPGGAHLLHAAGAGDLILRTKVNLFGNEGGPALALIPYVKFPTAARYIGNGHTEGGLIGTFTYPLPYGFTLLLEPEVDLFKNAADAGHHFNFTQLINISHPVGTQLTLYGELYSAIGPDNRSPPIYTLDFAAEYALTSSMEVDVGSNIGLNKNAPNIQLYTGIAQRF